MFHTETWHLNGDRRSLAGQRLLFTSFSARFTDLCGDRGRAAYGTCVKPHWTSHTALSLPAEKPNPGQGKIPPSDGALPVWNSNCHKMRSGSAGLLWWSWGHIMLLLLDLRRLQGHLLIELLLLRTPQTPKVTPFCCKSIFLPKRMLTKLADPEEGAYMAVCLICLCSAISGL